MRIKLLTARERQTLDLFLRGDSEKEVGRQLGISVNTVHVYARSLYQRFDVNSRSQLLSLFVEIHGTPGEPPDQDREKRGRTACAPGNSPLEQRLLDVAADVERAAADAILRGPPRHAALGEAIRRAMQKLKAVSDVLADGVPIAAEQPRRGRRPSERSGKAGGSGSPVKQLRRPSTRDAAPVSSPPL